MGTEKKPAKTKQYQSSHNGNYYALQFAVTERNKARRAAKRARLALKRKEKKNALHASNPA